MPSYNKVTLIGHLTRDVEIRPTAGGAMAKFGLAINDRRKTKDGEWVEDTTFVDVTMWGRSAEVAGEYLSKGSPALVEGKLRLDTWESKEGEKRSKLVVIGESLVLLGGRPASSDPVETQAEAPF